MNELLLRAKFVWEYATHLQTDADPPIELIFKFVNTLDKKDTKVHIKNFDKLPVAKKIYDEEVSFLTKVSNQEFQKGTFGHEFKKWYGNDNKMIDLFSISLNPFRQGRNKNTKFNKYAEATMLEHDLIHFVNGYNTSPVGEICVLSFNLAKEWRKSYATILFASFLMAIRNTFKPSKYPKGISLKNKIMLAPAYVFIRLVIEGYLRGKRSKWFLAVDWDSYLDLPMDKLKKDLKLFDKPKYWNKILPYVLIMNRHYNQYARKKENKRKRQNNMA